MSLEEQDLILGRLTRQTKEAKSRVVALERKLLDYSIFFDRTSAGLHTFVEYKGRHGFHGESWPSASDIEATLSDLDRERQQLATFEAQLSSIR